jgi:hypothetical protein
MSENSMTAECIRDNAKSMDVYAEGLGVPAYTALVEEIKMLRGCIDKINVDRANVKHKVNQLEDYVKQALAAHEMDVDTACELAEIGGFSITENTKVTLTIEVDLNHIIGLDLRDTIEASSFEVDVDWCEDFMGQFRIVGCEVASVD